MASWRFCSKNDVSMIASRESGKNEADISIATAAAMARTENAARPGQRAIPRRTIIAGCDRRARTASRSTGPRR